MSPSRMVALSREHGGPGARAAQKPLIGPWGHGTIQEESPGEPYGDHAVTRALLAERLSADPRPWQPQYAAALVAASTIYLEEKRPTCALLPVVPADGRGM